MPAKKIASKKISKAKKDEIESNLILFGLILVLILSLVTFWHVNYENSQEITNTISSDAANSDSLTKEMMTKADLNQDSQIDAKDAKLMKEAFLKTDPESLKADLNQDQRVDAKDYSLFNNIINAKEKDTNATK